MSPPMRSEWLQRSNMRESKIPPGFWSIWTTVAMDLLGFGIIIPLLPLYAESFGASPTTIGLLFASYSLAQFVASPIWGRVSDRVGRKPVLVTTIVGSAIGSLVLGFSGSIAMLFVGRILDGASGASVAVARATVADVATVKDRARLMGLLGAAFGFGFVVGPVVGSLASVWGSSAPFLLAAGVSVVNAVTTWIRVPETRPADQKASASPVSVRSLPPVVRRLVFLTFVGVTAFASFEATFSLLASDRLGLGEGQIGFVFAGLGIVLVATQAGLIGPASRRFDEMQLIRAGLAMNVVGFAFLSNASDWVGMVPGLVLLALGQGLITPMLSSSISGQANGRGVGAALGAQQSAGGLARVIGPALGGVLYGIGTPIPYVVAAGLTLLAIPIVPSLQSSVPLEA